MPKHSRSKKTRQVYLDAQAAIQDESDLKMRSAGGSSSNSGFVIDRKKKTAPVAYKNADERKLAHANKLTTKDRVLAQNPKVPDITKKSIAPRTLTPKQTTLADKLLKNKQQTAERDAKRRKLNTAPSQSLDLWGDEKPKDNTWEWIEDALEDPEAPKKAHKHTKRLQIPSVILPQPGQSYRPSAEDHEDTLASAIAIAKERNEQEAGAEDVLRGIDAKGKFLLRVDVNDKPPTDDTEFEPYEKPETPHVTRFVRKRRDTKLAKKKYDMLREATSLVEEEFERLPNMLETIEKHAVLKEKQDAERKVYKKELKNRTPKFGTNTPYIEPITPVAFKSEISKNLKSHKSLVNPLLDRYQSLVRTGKVVPYSGKKQAIPRAKKSVIKYNAQAQKLMSASAAHKFLNNQ